MSETLNFRRGARAAVEATIAHDVEVGRLVRSREANRYPGACRTCHIRVEAGEGVVFQMPGESAWIVIHKDGQCPLPIEIPRIEAKTGQVYTGLLWPGIYTMVDANGAHVTYRVRVQATTDKFAPGETIIDYLSGPDNTSDYTSFAFVRDGSLVVWKRFRLSEDVGVQHKIRGALALLRDPSRATVARTCIRCNALLTVPESLEAGMGPTCRSKGW